MRPAVLATMTLPFLVPVVFLAQAPAADGPPNLQIVKQTWAKERIGWERDPMSAPVERPEESRERIRNERRPRSALEERNIQVAREEKNKPTDPPRYTFAYRLVVHNTADKAITEIDWDYVFTDDSTGEEMGRREFTSFEKVGAGKRKELIARVSAPPTHTISVYKLAKGDGDRLSERIIVLRIQYEDGTVWTPGP